MPVTELDRENAARRQEIADRTRAAIEEAVAACGPGAHAYGVWSLTDRASGEKHRLYCCLRDGGGWEPQPQYAAEERLTAEQHPGYEFNGERVFPFRYEVGFHALSEYRPKSAEQLADARDRRIAKKRDAERQRLTRRQRESLFPEMYEDDLRSLELEAMHG